jgi:hypothetical protein
VPYGYTALNVMTGATLIRTHGLPATGAALLFLGGAAAGWGAIAALAGGHGEPPAGRWRGLWSGVAAAVAFGVASAIAHAVHGPLAFGLVAFAATAAYLGVGSLGPALPAAAAADRHDERRPHVHPH